MPLTPTIPENIVVHLGAPNESVANVTLPFQDYIKNVASSEIYPTWPEEALKANILAQISVALNRVYTQYYRSAGYDFDITSSPAYDQTFVYQRDIFGNISALVDEIFDSYIKKGENVEPLFAEFCDGVEVQCNGLEQWGSVRLAEAGSSYLDILRRYYGDDITVVTGVPQDGGLPTAPDATLREGDTGREVELIQRRLNRISANYPGIPKIYPTDGFFDRSTTDAVRKFQEVFGLETDGLVGRATWNEIQFVYSAVKRLYFVNSEGLSTEDISTAFPGQLTVGSSGEGVRTVQYFLDYISLFVPTVSGLSVDGSFGASTEESVRSFQRTYGLPVTGAVDRATWDRIESVYFGIISRLDYSYRPGSILPFPGRVLRAGLQGDDVRTMQEYLNYIARTYPQIPTVAADGDFGTATGAQVRAFKELFGLPGAPERVSAPTWNAITNVYDDLYVGDTVNEGQYPGYELD